MQDQVPAWDGWMFSNLRANLLAANQSKVLGNCDVDKLGKTRTRRGTVMMYNPGLGTSPSPSNVANTIIQGLCSYQTATANYVVAANNAKLWAWNETADTWTQIGLGGTADGEAILVTRFGAINNAGGYPAGTTALTVDTVGGAAPAAGAARVEIGEKLYFVNNIRTDYFEYTIKAVTPDIGTGGPVTQITLEDPGLVFDVKDNWAFVVLRPATVHNPVSLNRYPAGATSIAITGYVGVPNVGEKFVIKSENVTHTLTAGSTNVLLNFSTGLQADWVGAGGINAFVTFAQGNDSLFFTDGVGPIYAWTGGVPTSSTTGPGTLMKIGSHSILDDFNGSFHSARTTPPQNVNVLLWFQNRLIASGISTEPDAVYFSDFFDGTSWDADYQKTRIGGGESDPITGILAWTDLNAIIFKKNSCYLINCDPTQNPDPTDPTLLVASFAVRQLHKLIGCPAPRSAIQVGGGSTTPGSDVFFVDGDKKVHSIRRVLAAETQQEVGQAMSLPIQDVLDQINIQHIDTCCAMYHNEHYILAFPSMRGVDGGLLPNATVAYNMLTNSWCGVWSWAPTCFSRRTDLGSFSKLILGDWRGGHGRVLQWQDDISLDQETDTSYDDLVPQSGRGVPMTTQILTRAFTGGDLYSYKTGLNVEFEFDESVAQQVIIKVIIDMVTMRDPITGSDTIAPPFSSLSEPRLRLPFTLGPSTSGNTFPKLSNSPGLLRRAFDLQRYGTWRELQFSITTLSDKLAIRSIRITYFMDTLRLQTIPNIGVIEPPTDLPTFP
jgi:hypothetical protein